MRRDDEFVVSGKKEAMASVGMTREIGIRKPGGLTDEAIQKMDPTERRTYEAANEVELEHNIHEGIAEIYRGPPTPERSRQMIAFAKDVEKTIRRMAAARLNVDLQENYVDLRRAQERVAELEKEREELVAQLREHTKESAVQKAITEAVDRATVALDNECSALRRENHELKSKVAELTTSKKKLREALERAKK